MMPAAGMATKSPTNARKKTMDEILEKYRGGRLEVKSIVAGEIDPKQSAEYLDFL